MVWEFSEERSEVMRVRSVSTGTGSNCCEPVSCDRNSANVSNAKAEAKVLAFPSNRFSALARAA